MQMWTSKLAMTEFTSYQYIGDTGTSKLAMTEFTSYQYIV